MCPLNYSKVRIMSTLQTPPFVSLRGTLVSVFPCGDLQVSCSQLPAHPLSLEKQYIFQPRASLDLSSQQHLGEPSGGSDGYMEHAAE